MSQPWALESAGRITASVVVGLASFVFFVVFLVEYTNRPVLVDADTLSGRDTPSLLLGADIAATLVGCASSVLLLLPEVCCEVRRKDDPRSRSDARRERCTGAVVLVVSVVVLSATARVRDVNISPEEHHVCGTKGSVASCPTTRVNLSPAYVNWLKAEPPSCWLNTSSPMSSSFTWGKDQSNLSFYPTSDFSDPNTYLKHPEYSKCFYWGCSELCNKESFNQQQTMLALEVALAIIYTGFAVVFMCVSLPEESYAYVLPPKTPAVGAVAVRYSA